MMFSFSPADVSYLNLVYPALVPHCFSTGSGPCGQEFLWWHDETVGGRSDMLAASMKVHADDLWIGQDKRFLIRWFVMICCCSDSNIFTKIWTCTCWRPRAPLQNACLVFFLGGGWEPCVFRSITSYSWMVARWCTSCAQTKFNCWQSCFTDRHAHAVRCDI